MVSSISFAQKGIRVTYVKGLKTRVAPVNSPPSILKDISFSLIATNKESIFHFNKDMRADNLENRRHASEDIYYRNLETKILLQKETFIDGVYLISDKFDQYKWKLHKDLKKIGKYKCYKATYKKLEINPITQEKHSVKIIAWYTLDIPLPFGPRDFGGLPGLILFVKVGGVYYIANKVQVNVPIASNEIKKPTKGQKMTREQFNKHLEKKFSKYYKK